MSTAKDTVFLARLTNRGFMLSVAVLDITDDCAQACAEAGVPPAPFALWIANVQLDERVSPRPSTRLGRVLLPSMEDAIAWCEGKRDAYIAAGWALYDDEGAQTS